MHALRNDLITRLALGTDNHRPIRSGLTFARMTANMRSHDSRSDAPHARAFGQKLSLSVLAATLALTAALPVIAGESPHKRHGNEQRQEQDASAEAHGKKKNGGKAKTVKKIFANDSAMAIPGDDTVTAGPADLYPSAIAVTGFKKAKISDVNLTLRGLSHGFPRDLDLLLVAPNGRNALVMSDVGSNDAGDSDVVDLTLRLDDEAAARLPSTEVLVDGTFRPFNVGGSDVFPAPAPEVSANTALSTFDGIDPNGQWQLFVVDNGNADTGAIADGWTLEITAKAKNKK
jgi:subtilisin-like proprotein convertase family protein